MSGAILSYGLLAGLAIALLYAAFTDIRRREIDNTLNLGIALAAPLWWLAMGMGWQQIGFQLGLALLTFVIACVLFALRQMGGGDVKLLTALALWFTPGAFLQLVVLMAVIGGGGSIAMAAFNMKRMPGETWRDALAFLAAATWTLGAAAVIFALATGRPLVSQAAVRTISALIPGAWVVALVVLAVLALLGLGFHQIMRRQKSRLPIPYGVAISAAGLWVLAAETRAAIEFSPVS
ncbi:prepilin peptidase [Novosphingobium sp. YJ-S2-02]|uniref:Prepilin peptidase n=1 Tax=Novosphingobium aureum TaxID=2792964 RepID=A0A931MKJ7_9SPHN|nr:prepilin peptidase [Novosphingobium aureum]MBH0112540.1 prepilin peptidase [Novosphingobium aureum]